MIGNILKKDWKLMGRSAIGIIALQLFFLLLLDWQGDFHPGGVPFMPFLLVHPLLIADLFLWPAAAIFWVLALVHQDPLPGTQQDWLTRPIPRKDMLLAKLLFATAVVQGSTIAADLIHGLVSGFSLGQILRAALVRAATGFVLFTLPALLLGALTQNISETRVVTGVLGVGVIALTLAANALSKWGHPFDATGGTAIAWIPNLLRLFLVLAVGAALLWMQYRTRATFRGRAALAGLLAVLVASQALPWTTVFAVQSRLSPQPGAAAAIAMNWNPSPTAQDRGTSGHYQSNFLGIGGPTPNKWTRLLLPVSVTGLQPGSMLIGDNSQVVVSDANGKILQEVGSGGMSLTRGDEPAPSSVFKQLVVLPEEFYRENADRPVHLQTTYSMTLFKLGGSYTMPAVGGDLMVPGLGRCLSSIHPNGELVVVACTQMGSSPICATVYMQDPRDGSRNPGDTSCSPDYAPYQQRPVPEAMTRIGFISQFSDRSGERKYPVDATRLDHAQIVLRVYDIAEHFTRVVNSPLIPLKDAAEKKDGAQQ